MADTRQDGGVVVALFLCLIVTMVTSLLVEHKLNAEVRSLRQQLSQQQNARAEGCEGRK